MSAAMHTFVTEPGPLLHLRYSGFIVAPDMVVAHRTEALRLDRLIDRMDDAYTHLSDMGRYGAAPDSRKGALHEFVKVAAEFAPESLIGPLYARVWMAQRHSNRAGWAHAEAIGHARDLELARFGINIYDVEGLGYEALHLMRAEAVELDVFRDEVARHLCGAELDAAVLRYARDLEGRPRCVACLYVDEHPVDCPLHPDRIEAEQARVLAIVECVGVDVLRAAVERGSAIGSFDELLARGAELANAR